MNEMYLVESSSTGRSVSILRAGWDGNDSYYIKDLATKEEVKSFDIPWCSSPEEEWKTMPPAGRRWVRENGWGPLGDFKNAIAFSLQYVGFTESDAHTLCSEVEDSEKTVQDLFAEGVASVEYELSKEVISLYENIFFKKQILLVWDNLDAALITLEEKWSEWELPEE